MDKVELIRELTATVARRGKLLTVAPGFRVPVGSLLVFSRAPRSYVILLACPSGVIDYGVMAKRMHAEFVTWEGIQEYADFRKRKFDKTVYSTLDVFTPPDTILAELVLNLKARLLKDGSFNQLSEQHSELMRQASATSLASWHWPKRIVTLLRAAKTAYYNTGKPIMSDADYDYYESLLKHVDPENAFLQEIGAPVEGGRKVKLSEEMASLNKVTHGSGKANVWIKDKLKGNDDMTAAAKLDGLSMQLLYKLKNFTGGFSRGDGTIGQDVTAAARMIPSVPKKVSIEQPFSARGEVVMPNSAFNSKYAKTFANPRNMISGQINRKTPDGGTLKDAKFYAHGILGSKLSKKEQYKRLDQLGFLVAPHITIDAAKAAKLDDAQLAELVSKMKARLDVEMDGLVMTINGKKAVEEGGGNPKYSVAFKDEATRFTAEVGEVLWRVSRFGQLKPRVMLKKGVKHLGSTITFATGHNAAFIRDNKIGPGAIVEMSKRGEIIPKVERIVRKATKAQLPPGLGKKWEWNESGIEAVMLEQGTDDQMIRANAHFFAKIEAENIQVGTIQRLWDAGFKTIPQIIEMSVDDFMSVDGIQEKSAEKLHRNIRGALNGIDLPLLASASATLGKGFGTSRLYEIWGHYGNDMFSWVGWKKGQIIAELSGLPSIGPTLARDFTDGIAAFIQFYKQIKKFVKLNKPEDSAVKVVSQALSGMSFVWTGFRDAETEAIVVRNGGRVGSGVNKDTTVLIAKDPGSGHSKFEKAKALGVKVMSRSQFAAWINKQGAK